MQAVHLLVAVAQNVPAAHEQNPVESIVVNWEAIQVVHDNLPVQVAQDEWQVSQRRVLF